MAQVHKIGRRKTSTARVYLQSGKGEIVINKRPFETYFPLLADRNTVMLPLRLAELEGQYDIKVTVAGGGVSGQADAVQLGIARAVDEMFPDKHSILKAQDLFTRDDRMVERKKYGQPKARKKFQFSKR
ncbi:MAG: 30S ribosomal protein S9 [Cyclonatronaceae bacterium]